MKETNSLKTTRGYALPRPVPPNLFSRQNHAS
jgi:hypothetical protein